MRRVLITLAVMATMALAARPKWHQLDGYTFDMYVKDFQKPHRKGTLEWRKRESLFNAELKEVRTHNVGGFSWKKGVNHLSDWTEEERKTLRGARPMMKKHTQTAPERLYTPMPGPRPRTVDWRNAEPRVLTAVKDQGMCGSCWAHAATESIESHAALATDQLYVLSQQQITSCTPNPQQCGGTGGCNGAIAELAFDYIKTVGITQEWVEPYTSYFGNSGTCGKLQYPVVNVSGYTLAGHNDAEAALDALARAGPLAVSVDASSWSNYESGVFSGCSYAKNISMDHAVQAVGYGFDTDLGLHYWLIRNSWSPGWGEYGFIRLLRSNSTTHECGWNVDPQNGDGCKGQTAPEWACGMCGVAYDALYPNFAQFSN